MDQLQTPPPIKFDICQLFWFFLKASLTQGYPRLPKVTKGYPRLPKFTQVYPSVPKVTQGHPWLPKFTNVWFSLVASMFGLVACKTFRWGSSTLCPCNSRFVPIDLKSSLFWKHQTCMTLAVRDLLSSSQSRPIKLAVTPRLASLLSVTRHPPLLSSGSSSKHTLPRWRMAAIAVYTDVLSASDTPMFPRSLSRFWKLL